MKNWVEFEKGNVKIKHHSTSSLIEVIITDDVDALSRVIWLEYKTFNDLKNVLIKTELK